MQLQENENRGQGFLGKMQLSNIWCGSCKETWNWRDREAESRRAERVKCSICRGRDIVIWKVEWKGKIFCLPYRTGRKVPWWN